MRKANATQIMIGLSRFLHSGSEALEFRALSVGAKYKLDRGTEFENISLISVAHFQFRIIMETLKACSLINENTTLYAIIIYKL